MLPTKRTISKSLNSLNVEHENNHNLPVVQVSHNPEKSTASATNHYIDTRNVIHIYNRRASKGRICHEERKTFLLQCIKISVLRRCIV